VYFSAANAAQEAGDSASAKRYSAQGLALHDSVMANASNIPPLELFRWGVAVFRANAARQAAEAFESGLVRNPYYRNALFNLTNAYFQMAQSAQERNQQAAVRENARKMIDAGKRVLAVDPRSAQVIRLMAAGYQLLARDDSTDIWLKRANELTWEVDVQVARETSGGYEVQGTIRPIPPTRIHALRDSITRDSTRLETVRQSIQTGTDPQTGRAIPASQRTLLQQRQTTLQRRLEGLRTELRRLQAPVSIPPITFEFLNARGEAVATEPIAAQAIESSARKEFQLTATGEGIVAWRYKVP
jgi:tetratricopeptide (TPR) repeat protein